MHFKTCNFFNFESIILKNFLFFYKSIIILSTSFPYSFIRDVHLHNDYIILYHHYHIEGVLRTLNVPEIPNKNLIIIEKFLFYLLHIIHKQIL